MDEGSFRCDANVSVRPVGQAEYGTKAEVKNMNSFRGVFRAIEYEIKRQTEVLERGERVVQETRGWVDERGITVSQRSKEQAHDYRYFPEPDLPPIFIAREWVDELKAQPAGAAGRPPRPLRRAARPDAVSGRPVDGLGRGRRALRADRWRSTRTRARSATGFRPSCSVSRRTSGDDAG